MWLGIQDLLFDQVDCQYKNVWVGEGCLIEHLKRKPPRIFPSLLVSLRNVVIV